MSQYISYPASGGGVSSVNTFTGDVVIAAGTGITVTDLAGTITIASTSAGDVTLGTFGSTPNASGASISGSQVLTLQPADATNPGGVTTGTQSFAGAKTFTGAITASNLSGTNTGDQAVSTLTDATITTPTSGQVLSYNGAVWVNANSNAASAPVGVTFYKATPVVQATGTGNAINISSLVSIPVTTAEQTIAASIPASTTVAISAWSGGIVLGRTQIPAGTWTFNTFAAVDALTGNCLVTEQMYKISPYTSPTVTMTGTGTSRTATASSGAPFSTSNIDASATNTTASFISTASGIYQITARTSDTEVTIATLSGYVNDSAVAFKVWKKLFGATASDFSQTAVSLLTFSPITQPAFTIALTDFLGNITFASSSSGTRTVTLYYDDSSHSSYLQAPFLVLHNELPGLNGGSANQYYHLTAAEYTSLQAGYANQTLSNLGTTAINVDLLSAQASSWSVKTQNATAAVSQPIVLASGDTATSGATGTVTIKSGTPASTSNSGLLTMSTGPGGSGSATSGSMTLSTGTTVNGTSGLMLLQTGASSGGISGAITIKTGTAEANSAVGNLTLTTGFNGVSQSGGLIDINTGSRDNAAISIHTNNINGSGWVNLYSGNGTTAGSGRVTINTGTSSTFASGALDFFTGSTTSGTSGAISLTGGASSTGASGNIILQGGSAATSSGLINIKTGDATSTNSGAITIQTGTAGATRGNITLNAPTVAVTGAATVSSTLNVTTSVTAPFFIGVTGGTYTAQTGTYVAVIGDIVKVTSGTFTATLPTAVGHAGRSVEIDNYGTGVVTIATNGGTQTIAVAGTALASAIIKLASNGDRLKVTSDGANWIASVFDVFVGARANTSTTTVSGTPATIVFTVEQWDSQANYDTGTGLFTVTIPGTYDVQGRIYGDATNALDDLVQTFASLNGAGTIEQVDRVVAALSSTGYSVGGRIKAVAGDTLSIRYSDSGTSPSIATSRCSIDVVRVGN